MGRELDVIGAIMVIVSITAIFCLFALLAWWVLG